MLLNTANMIMGQITKKQLEEIVQNCSNKKEAYEKAGIARATFNKLCNQYKISLEHFDPYLWIKSTKLSPLKKVCPNCGKQFETPKRKSLNRKCCSQSCANRRTHSQETKNKIGVALKIYKMLNPQKMSKIPRISKICPICNNQFKVWPSKQKRIYCSKNCYLQDNECKFRSGSRGGYRKGSGRSKHGWYKGFWCDSTYELCFIIYCLDHKLDIKRNSNTYNYVFGNKKHFYIPDFIVEGIIVEIKGYYNQLVDIKTESVGRPVIILYKEDLTSVFNYINKKYTKNYTKLYDKLASPEGVKPSL